MTIKQVRIHNVMGIKELTIQGGDWVQLSGKNGTCKTSVDRALRAALRGEISPQMLNNESAKNGEVLVLLDDGTEIRRRIGGANDLSIRTSEGHRVMSPAAWLKERFNAASIDPVELFDADAKKRIELLVSAVNVDLTTEALQEAVGDQVQVLEKARSWEPVAGTEVSFTRHAHLSPLQEIKEAEKEITKARRDVGARKKEKEAFISRLRDSLPEDDDGMTADEYLEIMEEAENKMEKLASTEDEMIREVRRRTDSDIKSLTELMNEEMQGITASIEDLQDQKRLLTQTLNERRTKETSAMERAIDMIRSKHREEKMSLKSRHDVAKAKYEMYSKHENTKSIIETEKEGVTSAQEKWDAYNESLHGLRNLKSTLTGSLNIPGVEIDDDIMYEGVQWGALNTAKRMEIAAKIAMLQGGKVLIIDRFETLDSEAQEALATSCADANVQLWTFAVSDEPELTATATDTLDMFD